MSPAASASTAASAANSSILAGLWRFLLSEGHAGAGAHRAGSRRAVPARGGDGAVNDARKSNMAMRVINACGGSVRGKTIAVLGLTFKPETDDMRDSPALPIVSRLAGDGASIRAFDPEGMGQAMPLLPESIVYCRDALDAAAGADAVVLITEWNEFRALSPVRLRDAMRGLVLVDLRNAWDPIAMRQAGFDYHGIGRPG